jgi:hypothetical protein
MKPFLFVVVPAAIILFVGARLTNNFGLSQRITAGDATPEAPDALSQIQQQTFTRTMFSTLKTGMTASDLVNRIGKGDGYEVGPDWMKVTYRNQDGSGILVSYQWHQAGQDRQEPQGSDYRNGYYMVTNLQILGTLRD